MDDRIPAFIAGRTLAARVRPCFKVTKCDLEPIYIKLLTQTRVWCLKLEVANSDFKFEARVNGARRGSRTPDILITKRTRNWKSIFQSTLCTVCPLPFPISISGKYAALAVSAVTILLHRFWNRGPAGYQAAFTTVLISTWSAFFMATRIAERFSIVGFPDFESMRCRLLLDL